MQPFPQSVRVAHQKIYFANDYIKHYYLVYNNCSYILHYKENFMRINFIMATIKVFFKKAGVSPSTNKTGH